MSRLKKLFIGATYQNDGKTVLSLGLIRALKAKGLNIGFIKPVGQRYLIQDNERIDEDSVLISRVCGLDCDLKHTSPIAIERGFTEKYILSGSRGELSKKILTSFERISKDKDLVIIEGTGHAGVGSVFDFSNAKVAGLLNSKVIIISRGGIGRPIDEIMLNKALFDAQGVKLIGVIINKVLPDKFDKINKVVREGLKRKGVKTFGVIPYHELLPKPTIHQILEETHAKLLTGGDYLNNIVEKIVVGAMEPKDALKYIEPKTLVITPGDREDMILAIIKKHYSDIEKKLVSGFVLSGGMIPSKKVLKKIKDAGIPVLLFNDHTYSTASAVHDIMVKIKPEDEVKIKLIEELVKKYVDLNLLYDYL